MSAMIGLFQRFNTLFSSYFSLCLRYGFALALGCFVIFKFSTLELLLHHQQQLLLKNSTSFSRQQDLIVKQLDRLENKLSACENEIKTHQALGDEVKICRTQLDTMKEVLHQVQEQTRSSALITTLKQAHVVFSSSINAPSKSFQTKTKSKTVAHAMRIRRLPFQVLNIDSWNGEPMVMVNHCGHTDLLSRHDTLAGWTVVDINFDAGWVRFKNRQNQRAKILL